ncbi:preprotein translocase subunit SecG [Gammaproteobacteria bacterium 45_16_T64]|nr:preprotein translocase subunit SecG [Gammaproteobacteria bacterium 45_16_T64]
METVLLIALVVVALGIVGLILIQQGKGADAGASFGSGASQTFFGSSGSGNFLTHSTAILAAIFFVLCLALAYIAREKAENAGSIDIVGEVAEVVKEVVTPSDVPSVDAPAGSGSDIPTVTVGGALESDVPVVELDSPEQ